MESCRLIAAFASGALAYTCLSYMNYMNVQDAKEYSRINLWYMKKLRKRSIKEPKSWDEDLEAQIAYKEIHNNWQQGGFIFKAFVPCLNWGYYEFKRI